MLLGASVIVLIFSIFNFLALMKALKYLLIALVLFVAQRYACQLLLGVCQLAFCLFTFTFYELELLRLSPQLLIWSGMREAKKREAHWVADPGLGKGVFQSINIDSNPAHPAGPSLCILHVVYFIFIIYFTQSTVIEQQ